MAWRSDRELYTALWEKGLREDAILVGRSRSGGWFHDCLGESDEDHLVWLRHYADDAARARHSGESLPPREPPPYSRDWRLPKGPC